MSGLRNNYYFKQAPTFILDHSARTKETTVAVELAVRPTEYVYR